MQCKKCGNEIPDDKLFCKCRLKTIGLIVSGLLIISLIVLSAYNYSNRKSYEKEYVSRAKELASEYNLKDANISFDYAGKRSGYRIYDLVAESSDFENLDNFKKFNFVKLLDKIRVDDSEFIVLSHVVSNKDQYKIDVLNDNVLDKNGSEYYSNDSKQEGYSTTSTSETYSTNEYAIPKEADEDDKGFVWAAAENTVKERLKAPSTADFPFSYYGQDIKEIGYNRFVVNSYVDAENGFGAKIRTYFSVTIKKTGEETYIVEECKFNE